MTSLVGNVIVRKVVKEQGEIFVRKITHWEAFH